MPSKIFIRWRDYKKTNVLKTHNADVVPDIGVPMLILPGSHCYDCGYGQECNVFNKSKKKKEHKEKLMLTTHKVIPE